MQCTLQAYSMQIGISIKITFTYLKDKTRFFLNFGLKFLIFLNAFYLTLKTIYSDRK